ncbi:hypothetical protein Tco_0969800 [Tanacetum coccineum]
MLTLRACRGGVDILLRRWSGDVGNEVMGWRWGVAWGDDGDDLDDAKMMMTMRGGGDDGGCVGEGHGGIG